jgi:proton glutamate symport protein
MDMGRTSVNVIGNCLASVVIAKWEGEFDQEKALNFVEE